MMQTHGKAAIDYSTFSNNDVDEIHLFISPSATDTYEQQLTGLLKTLDQFITDSPSLKPFPVFIRFFISDYANQASLVSTVRTFGSGQFGVCALSVVQQPPLTGEKVVAWVYLIRCRESGLKQTPARLGSATVMNRNGYEHCWSTGLAHSNGAFGSYDQTDLVLKSYQDLLVSEGMTLKENCIRTWIYVRDVDFNYKGVVEARRKYFEQMGMTSRTHFIASTGIEGRHADPGTNVLMDAYSISGIRPEQIRYLTAPEMLNPTHEYGVTFERGTSVDYGDRRHIFISGTASIDRHGQVCHKGDVRKQAARALDNICALLADAGATMDDVRHFIIYLRDVSDRRAVESFFRCNCPRIPGVIVLAPVCRPEWLIEMECMAVKPARNPQFSDF